MRFSLAWHILSAVVLVILTNKNWAMPSIGGEILYNSNDTISQKENKVTDEQLEILMNKILAMPSIEEEILYNSNDTISQKENEVTDEQLEILMNKILAMPSIGEEILYNSNGTISRTENEVTDEQLEILMNKILAMPSIGEEILYNSNGTISRMENEVTDEQQMYNEVNRVKLHDTNSAQGNMVYFILGVIIILLIVAFFHWLLSPTCNGDRMRQRSFDRMLHNERHRGQHYDLAQFRRSPSNGRFPTHPEISLPLIDIPSRSNIFPTDPFYRSVIDNLHLRHEEEGNSASRHIYATHSPRRAEISSPLITSTSQL